jgi:hypothetical protein
MYHVGFNQAGANMKSIKFFSVFVVATLVLTMAGRVSSDNRSIYLPLVINTSTQTPPTSIQLILKDLAAGKLDTNTAAVYQVYSLFTNSPLPAQYRGAPDLMADIAPMNALWAVYDSLSVSQKAAIDPYLLRPDNPTSAAMALQQDSGGGSPSGGLSVSATRPVGPLWDYVDTATGVRIHYRLDIEGDHEKAVGVGEAIDGKIYTSFMQLMNRIWLDDTGCKGGSVVDDGGNGALDIYLMHDMTSEGTEISCHKTPTPGWVRLNANRDIGDETHSGMIQTATHEMFHTIQDSYTYLKGEDYLWMQEATAMWIEDYVYKNAQSEQGYAHLYLDTTRKPIYENPDNMRFYGAYLWPYYLTRIKSYSPNIIRTMFENAKSYKSIDLFFLKDGSGPPVTNFADFAVKNWNQAPFDNYQTIDKLSARVKVQYQDTISGVSEKKYYVLKPDDGSFQHLTAMYYDFIFTDNSARTVTFYNGINNKLTNKTGVMILDPNSTGYSYTSIPYDDFKEMNVQALIKINNTWTREDWTIESQKFYCRDQKAQRIQELVLIVTNSNWDEDLPNFAPADANPTLMVSPVGCWQWKGTFDVNDPTDPGVTNLLTGDVIFERNSYSWIGPDISYHVKSGNAHLHFSGTSSESNFTFAADGWVTLSETDGTNILDTYNLVTGGPHPKAYWGNGTSNQEVAGKESCYCGDDGEYLTYDTTFFIGTWFLTPDPINPPMKLQSRGNIIDGTYTTPNGIIYHWHLESQAEP